MKGPDPNDRDRDGPDAVRQDFDDNFARRKARADAAIAKARERIMKGPKSDRLAVLTAAARELARSIRAGDMMRDEAFNALRRAASDAGPAPKVSEANEIRAINAELDAKDDGPAGRFKELYLDEISLDEDEPAWLIEGLLPAGPSFGAVVGRPKSLKSFLAMHRGLHIAGGLPYCGRAVRQGPVIYITNEGIRGVKQRLVAMKLDLGLNDKNVPFILISEMPNLGASPGDYQTLKERVDRIAQRLGVAPAVIDLDTLRRAIPGKDENSSKDLGVFVDNSGRLGQDFGCHVSANHHSPRSDDARSSGSNALDGAVDVMWSCVRQGVERKATASLAYMKDGPEDGVAWKFGLRDYPLVGPEGGKFTPCVVDILSNPGETAAATQTAAGKPEKDTKTKRKFREAFIEALDSPGPDIRVRTDGQKAVDLQAVRREFERRYVTGDGDTQKRADTIGTAWRRLVRELPAPYETEVRDGKEWIWNPQQQGNGYDNRQNNRR
jgi:hypothetical protein